MKKYKATLFKLEYEATINGMTINEPQVPVDSVLLDKKCYTTAENFFFNKRGWTKTEPFHIEIEDMPRFLA